MIVFNRRQIVTAEVDPRTEGIKAGNCVSNSSFDTFSAGIDFRLKSIRQNLTSVDVRFWRLKSIPAL